MATGWRLPLTTGLLACAATALPPGPAWWLLWHAPGAWQRPWAWWTAPLVHLSAAHLLANLLALAALAVLAHTLALDASARRRMAWAIALAWPAGTAALQLWPGLHWYGGLSGGLHALAAILAWHALALPGHRVVGMVLAGGLVAKLLLEQAWQRPVAFDPAWGFNVVLAAHLSGALAGWLTAGVLHLHGLWQGFPQRRRAPHA